MVVGFGRSCGPTIVVGFGASCGPRRATATISVNILPARRRPLALIASSTSCKACAGVSASTSIMPAAVTWILIVAMSHLCGIANFEIEARHGGLVTLGHRLAGDRCD